MVAASVAVEAGGGFEWVDHEAVAGAGGEDGGLLRAGPARWGVGHLLGFELAGKIIWGRENGIEGASLGPIYWVAAV